MRKKLREARLESGLLQADVAIHLRISVRQYQRIEKNERGGNGTIAQWDMLEDLLGVPQRYLRKVTNNEKKIS